MKSSIILMAVLAGILTACTTVPSDLYYGPLRPDSGYSIKRRGIDTWAVRFTGDQYMTGSVVRDLTLLTCADLTTEAGYSWFVITHEVNESGHFVHTTSFSGVPGTQISSSWSGGVDTLTGSRTAHTRFISQYRYEIQCYHEEPADPDAFDAIEMADQIRVEYGIEQPGGSERLSEK